MKYFFALCCLWCSSALAAKSKIVTALEAFPPLITADGKGLVIDLLEEIEAKSNYQFEVSIMTYARSKRELFSKRAQLIGLTPKQQETEEFYDFAQELDWEIPASVDLFVTDKAKIANYKSMYIGVPTGNADFFSELLNIPRTNFVEVTHLNQLTKMLSIGRIDGIIFERIAVTETIRQTGDNGIYYHQLAITPASLAVSNSPEGRILRNELDYYIRKVNTDSIFETYNHYLNLPTSGSVKSLLEITPP
ncbi:substrate-binding periplasmic protein [Thalassotalea euphylliae]|uniref:substrate-binding periplasmic protein n=1 Tax=Thalassotalea euphylliae TaxID=1655234 RepID=UPI0036314F7D